ncbi:MAG: hypothetical protein HYZ32_00700, partial [Hydrocarboniphaga effusa]|nr:hypothetical protein [Hydrocarboniphaga effusa]
SYSEARGGRRPGRARSGNRRATSSCLGRVEGRALFGHRADELSHVVGRRVGGNTVAEVEHVSLAGSVVRQDRPGARAHWCIDQVFDLFDRLGANEQQLDFPIVYASALHGYAGNSPDIREGNMDPLFQTIVDRVRAPDVDVAGPFQMQITSLAYSSYVGVIGTGRIKRGRVKTNMPVAVIDRDGHQRMARVLQVLGFMGLDKIEVPEAQAGDIVALTGIADLGISETVCDPTLAEGLPTLQVDEPTMSMGFEVNKSPFVGQDGKFVTSRQIAERLERELKTNVALRVDFESGSGEAFKVSGRGLLHLGILLENMRREGYEVAVSRPEVIEKEIDGVLCEPFESLVADVESQHQGGVIEALAKRGGQMKNMVPDGKGRVRLEYAIPTRGLIGFQTEFMSMTSGTGMVFHNFDHYGEKVESTVGERHNGVLISNEQGKVLA